MGMASFRNKRRRRPGDLSSLRRTLWAALLTGEELADNPDPAVRLRALHAISQLAATYLRAIEVSDIEERLRKLEAAVQEGVGRRVS